MNSRIFIKHVVESTLLLVTSNLRFGLSLESDHLWGLHVQSSAFPLSLMDNCGTLLIGLECQEQLPNEAPKCSKLTRTN